MSSSLALLAWFICLICLLWFDPASKAKMGLALWVPVLWIFMAGSRLPSQWTSGSVDVAAQSLQDGNSLDRVVYLTLILSGMVILVQRRFQWGRFVAQNIPLCAFLFYALVSVVWSDYPDIALKRWIRDLGNYLSIMLILSEVNPIEAFRTALRRVNYLLIPLSIVLVKYFPAIGKQFEPWSGLGHYVGATTSKNMLGAACLISGLFFFWDTLLRWPERRDRKTRKVLYINGAFLLMTLWLLQKAHSATSSLCLILGCLIIIAAQTPLARRTPLLLQSIIPTAIVFYFLLSYGFGIDLNSVVAGSVGRDASFTGRTNIWSAVLSTHTNPLFGTGYESFWLGPRLQEVWRLAGQYNEAHDGYLELYLNLGFIGLGFLGILLLASYRTICKRMATIPPFGALGLALWAVLLLYNVTEAAFKGQLMWIIFLLGVTIVPVTKPAAGVVRRRFTQGQVPAPAPQQGKFGKVAAL